MKMKGLLLASFMMIAAATGCGENVVSSAPPRGEIVIWVGSEAVAFYTDKLADYKAIFEEKNGVEFGCTFKVQGVDAGAAASKLLDDVDAGGDIITIPHDNLGKLTSGGSAIRPILGDELIQQIADDNPSTFVDVSRQVWGDTEYQFGVPVVGQSLVLYYNKKYLNETDVQSWEGILAKAQANNKKATSLMGTDTYNNSFLTLAQRVSDHKMAATIYGDGSLTDCDFTNEEVVSIMKWGQRFFTNPNGGLWPTDPGFQVELQNETSISMIGGAWKFNGVKQAMGSANVGIAKLPKFTVNTSDVAETTATAGTQYYSGTFADTKMFVINKNSKFLVYLEDVLMYLSSKEIQEEAFIACDALPAYKNAATEFESMQGDTLNAQLARTQIEMFEQGIPQPFGYSTLHNFYYYQKGADGILKEILENKDGKYATTAKVREGLSVIERIWKTGK